MGLAENRSEWRPFILMQATNITLLACFGFWFDYWLNSFRNCAVSTLLPNGVWDNYSLNTLCLYPMFY